MKPPIFLLALIFFAVGCSSSSDDDVMLDNTDANEVVQEEDAIVESDEVVQEEGAIVDSDEVVQEEDVILENDEVVQEENVIVEDNEVVQEDEAINLLKAVFSIANADPVKTIVAFNEEYGANFFEENYILIEQLEELATLRFDCSTGGSLTWPRDLFPRLFIHDNCVTNAFSFNGEWTSERDTAPLGSPRLPVIEIICEGICSTENFENSTRYELENMMVTADRTQPDFLENLVGTSWSSNFVSRSNSEINYSATDVDVDENSINIAQQNSLETPPFSAIFTMDIGSLTLDGGASYSVTTSADGLIRPGRLNENPSSGTITISGSSEVITLNADSGDPESFLITVERDGVVTSFIEPWSDGLSLERFTIDDFDLGF